MKITESLQKVLIISEYLYKIIVTNSLWKYLSTVKKTKKYYEAKNQVKTQVSVLQIGHKFASEHFSN